jgi:hypothetical protein
MKSSNLPVRDYRIIVLSSSEAALGTIASKAGKPRKGGERVRLIDVPATFPGSRGIFDGELHGKTSIAETAKRVDQLRLDAELNQGFALRRFLTVFKKDAGAVSTLKGYMADFEARSSAPVIENADRRILKNFAVIYAAAALAIDYGILPWKKTPTLKAIDKCMVASCDAFSLLQGDSGLIPSAATVALRLKSDLEKLNIIKIAKGTKPRGDEITQRREADGFRIEHYTLIKSKRLDRFSPAEGKELVANKILLTEKRADNALTVSRKIAGIEQKLRYYIIDTTALDKFLPAGSATK